MFQSITYTKYLGYNNTTNLHEYECELVDSDFSCVMAEVAGVVSAVAIQRVVIREYSKRNLNVAANLIRCFKYHEKKFGWSIAEQIAWAESYEPLFTPEIKADLQNYL